jgi:hypothetical protein
MVRGKALPFRQVSDSPRPTRLFGDLGRQRMHPTVVRTARCPVGNPLRVMILRKYLEQYTEQSSRHFRAIRLLPHDFCHHRLR